MAGTSAAPSATPKASGTSKTDTVSTKTLDISYFGEYPTFQIDFRASVVTAAPNATEYLFACAPGLCKPREGAERVTMTSGPSTFAVTLSRGFFGSASTPYAIATGIERCHIDEDATTTSCMSTLIIGGASPSTSVRKLPMNAGNVITDQILITAGAEKLLESTSQSQSPPAAATSPSPSSRSSSSSIPAPTTGRFSGPPPAITSQPAGLASLSTAEKAGIGIGTTAVALMVIFILLWMLHRRHRRRRNRQVGPDSPKDVPMRPEFRNELEANEAGNLHFNGTVVPTELGESGPGEVTGAERVELESNGRLEIGAQDRLSAQELDANTRVLDEPNELKGFTRELPELKAG